MFRFEVFDFCELRSSCSVAIYHSMIELGEKEREKYYVFFLFYNTVYLHKNGKRMKKKQ